MAYRARIKWHAAYTAELCRRAVSRLFEGSGAHAVLFRADRLQADRLVEISDRAVISALAFPRDRPVVIGVGEAPLRQGSRLDCPRAVVDGEVEAHEAAIGALLQIDAPLRLRRRGARQTDEEQELEEDPAAHSR